MVGTGIRIVKLRSASQRKLYVVKAGGRNEKGRAKKEKAGAKRGPDAYIYIVLHCVRCGGG